MPEINEPLGDEPSAGISRRTVTKAMAWAVPVIAASSAVPAYAASQGILELTGEGCKLPGNSNSLFKGYVFGVSATNSFDVQINVAITSLQLDGQSLGGVGIVNLDGCVPLGANNFDIPANTTLSNLVFLTVAAPNSQNGELTAAYTVTGGPGGNFDINASVPVTPPVQGESCGDFTAAEKLCIASILSIT